MDTAPCAAPRDESPLSPLTDDTLLSPLTPPATPSPGTPPGPAPALPDEMRHAEARQVAEDYAWAVFVASQRDDIQPDAQLCVMQAAVGFMAALQSPQPVWRIRSLVVRFALEVSMALQPTPSWALSEETDRELPHN